MMKRAIRKTLAFAFALCLIAGTATVGAAATVNIDDFQPMGPLLDLVAGAAISASDFPAVISDGEGTLDPNFITFFFTNGLQADPSLGITQDMLASASLQEEYLKSVFSAQLPALGAITPPEAAESYFGFLPVLTEATGDGRYYLVGELYRGAMPIGKMGEGDYQSLAWEDRAIFTLKPDAAARGGYRIDGFSVGSEMLMETQLQNYTDAILTEYINTALGFSLLYPSLFADANFTEDATGISAVTPDGSASFMAKREDNTAGIGLSDYAALMAGSETNARMNVSDEFQYATVVYETADGKTVFSIYIVTDQYVYTAQLTYPTNQSVFYNMFTMYLENSFGADEVSVG